MEQKDFDKLIILQDYINRYANNELEKLKKVYTPNDLQKEFIKLFTIILQANKLEDQLIQSTIKKISDLESNVKYYKDRAMYLKQICKNNGLNTDYITYSIVNDL